MQRRSDDVGKGAAGQKVRPVFSVKQGQNIPAQLKGERWGKLMDTVVSAAEIRMKIGS